MSFILLANFAAILVQINSIFLKNAHLGDGSNV
jgi:hypothetical protein